MMAAQLPGTADFVHGPRHLPLACEVMVAGSISPLQLAERGGARDAAPSRLLARVLPLALLLALLGGCASLTESSFTVFADPGKYTYYNCEQIAINIKNWNIRESELRLLMGKAEQSTGGSMVNALAYQSDYATAAEELKVLEKTARSKNCNAAPAWDSNSAVR
jgi:hypothetical protein